MAKVISTQLCLLLSGQNLQVSWIGEEGGARLAAPPCIDTSQLLSCKL